MSVRVANIWKHHRTDGEERVYIGRACRDYPGSPLGNPWRVEPGNRGGTLGRYRTWLRQELKDPESPARAEVIRLGKRAHAGADLVLLCWCAPARCHGDIVAEAVERLARRLG